jgi:simple sugar transport system permease protein
MSKNLKFDILRTVLAIGIALAIAIIIILFVSKEPLIAIQNLLIGPIGTVRHFGNVIEMTIPLVFTGLAVSIMFKASQFNLGAEGAFFAGAIGASIIAMKVALPLVMHPVVAILIGGLIGAVITGIPAILKVRWGASELVSSLMLNYVAFYLGLYLINYYFRDVNAGAMVSMPFLKTASLMAIIPGTRIHFGIVIAAAMILITYYYMYKSKRGYEIILTGENIKFAEYSGIKTGSVILTAQLIGGFIAGVGGATEVLGMYTRFAWQALPGFGWDGVIVAILARNNPALVPIAAFFLAYLRIGADLMSRMSDVQNDVIAIIQGVMIVLIVATSFLAKYRHKMIFNDAKETLGLTAKEGK